MAQVDNVLLHIPHASLYLPTDQLGDLLVPYSRVKAEALAKADLYCDELFDIDSVQKITAKYSRLICDVERFPDDTMEPMAQKGQGVFYTRFDDGTVFRESMLRSKVKEEIYDVYHQKFTDVVNRMLDRYGRCLIIDCHSFSLPGEQPDVCIGADDFHTPPEMAESALTFTRRKGYTANLNSPYSGSIVPLEHYGKTHNVFSIMIELNRCLYLTTDYRKSENFGITKSLCRELFEILISHFTLNS